MPSGGLMQLVSYGAEDLYLTGNPQITYFKVVYRRHTNFAYEWVPVYFNPTLTFDTTSSVQMSADIPRNGDLVRDLSVVIDLPSVYSTSDENFKWIENIGEFILATTSITVAGQTINQNYGQWLNIWAELTVPDSKRIGYNELIGNVSEIYNPSTYYGNINSTSTPTIRKRRLRIQPNFWFNQHPGLALPLIAIQYVGVSVNITLRQLNDLYTIGIPAQSPSELFNEPNSDHNINLRSQLISEGFGTSNIFWKFINGTNQKTGSWNQNIFLDIKYVYLDSDERKLFAASINEYLITQIDRLEFTGLVGANNSVDIDFFHPVQEMIWVFQRSDASDRNQWSNYTTLPHNKDMPKYIDLQKSYNTAEELGLSPTSINDIVLPSGLTVSEFKNLINCTDNLKLFKSNSNAFDQIYNVMYYGEFVFNGHLRQENKTNYYYQYQEPFNYHTNTPDISKQIYMYSFAEKPEMVQPSGSANFSRISKPEFRFLMKSLLPVGDCVSNATYNYNLYFYVRSYNILRIMNGIAGLTFNN